MKKCYYEILKVPKDAKPSEINRQYKKLALELHPDKNINKPDATEEFMIIGEAYAVLSDPNERIWYDLHREEILRGPIDISSRGKSEYLSTNDLIPYRARQVFHKYNDEENGFYTVFGELYLKICLEEKEAMENDIFGAVKESLPNHHFGNETTHIDIVLEFYNYFSTFSTVKSFYWYDQYNSIEFGDRNSRRIADRTNKKHRDKAKKNFNVAVIELTAWVKRHDPRIQKLRKSRIQNAKLKSQQQLELRDSERQSFIQKAAAFVEPDWSKSKTDDYFCIPCNESFGDQQELYVHFTSPSHLEGVLEDEDVNEKYCIICEIQFNSINELQIHYTSNLHLQNIQSLKDEDELIIASSALDLESTEDTTTKLELNCAVCQKKYKMQSQLDQHLNSKPHKAKCKKSQRTQ